MVFVHHAYCVRCSGSGSPLVHLMIISRYNKVDWSVMMFSRVTKSAALIKGLVSDPIIKQLAIDTSLGKGFLDCQLRQRKDGTTYHVLKVSGGDTTVWVSLERESIVQLADFIRE